MSDDATPIRPQCLVNVPRWFTSHWRDWHRGHGCDKDDGKPRSEFATKEFELYAAHTRESTRGRKEVDGTGAPIVDTGLYYVQDTRTLVGNCISWWEKNREGYVCNLDDAGQFTGTDVRSMRDTDVPFPIEFVNERAVRHVRGDNADFARVSWSRKQSVAR